MRIPFIENFDKTYQGWELYWCLTITVLTVAYSLYKMHKYYKNLREKNEIIKWNVQERIALEKIIEQNNDSINSLREKVRYYKGISNKKNFRKP